MLFTILSLLIIFAGYIIALGAVTVIDMHGFLGRNSSYWTNATIVSHKITKPLIWLGTFLLSIGTIWFYNLTGITRISYIHWSIILILIVNGLFLSFWVSPRLIALEKSGKSHELLSQSIQKKILISFIFSFIGWWGSLTLFIYHLVTLGIR